MALTSIVPFEGLGELRFGTPRSAIHSSLRGSPTAFSKVVGAPTMTDSYDALGLHLYYDDEDKLEFIEAFPPCDPSYSGVRLLADELDQVLSQLAEMGHVPTRGDVGYHFDQLGFRLYSPHESAEAVSVFRRGYYDVEGHGE